MKSPFAIGFCAALCSAANAQLAPFDTASARSVSGQFLVQGARLEPAWHLPPELVTNLNYVELEPALLAVSCERIKQSLYRELGAPPAWRGRINLWLQPARGDDDPVTIVTERNRDGWNYRVILPQVVERQRFVRALVQSLLLEMANRRAGDRPAEIPAWLAEGLTQHLIGSREIELILPPPRLKMTGLTIGPAVVEARRRDPLEPARRALRERPPLTLEELSWPTSEQLAGDAGEAYRRSAQLFVTELLRLKNGRASLRAMLDELAGCYNWQTAFFRAFHANFTRQLDLEKWWALQAVHFSGRDPGRLPTVEESARSLDQILRTTVEVRRAANELPSHTGVTLQSVIREWDFLRQAPTLRGKLRDLEVARMRMAPEFAALADEYHQVLAAYLQRRQRPDLVLTSKTPPPVAKALVREVVKQLDALDARRTALHPDENPAAVGTGGGGPSPAS